MAVWLVRAGSGGEYEDLCLEEGVSVVGWHELPDLSERVRTKRGFARALLANLPRQEAQRCEELGQPDMDLL